MRRSLAVLLTLVFVSLSIAAESVEEIVEKNVEARGGARALAAVDSMRVTGHLLVQGMNIPYRLEWKRPNKVRFAYETHPGRESVQGFDGGKGWKLGPQSEGAEILTTDEVSRLLSRCDDLDSALLRARSEQSVVRLIGRSEVDGRDAYKLAIERPGTEVIYEYVDVKDHLVFRRERTSRIDGAEVDVVTSVSDYREVGGVLYPHVIESRLFNAGGEGRRALQGTQAFAVESVSLNVMLDESAFAMPSAR